METEARSTPPRIRMTRQRRILLEELRRCGDHPTADEIYRRVRRRLPRISLGTVYRNLELLTAQGEARKIHICGQANRFDGQTHRHHHVRCVRCGRLADLPAGVCRVSPAAVQRTSGFRVLDVRLELSGICRQCAESGGHGESTSPAARGGRVQPGKQNRRKSSKDDRRDPCKR